MTTSSSPASVLSRVLHDDLVQQLEFIRRVMADARLTSLPIQLTPKQVEALLALLKQEREPA